MLSKDEPTSEKADSRQAEVIPPSELTMKERLALFSKFQVSQAPANSVTAPKQQEAKTLEKQEQESEA